MSTLSKITLGFVGIVALIGLFMGSSYNSLVSRNQMVKQKFADIEAQYQRRFDLVPRVVDTVKGSARFEQATLESVIAARNAWIQAKRADDTVGQVAAAQSLDQGISRLLVTVEAYPSIKSTEAFRDLTTVLEGTENRIAVARQNYNEAVQTFNSQRAQFPTLFIARWFGFQEAMFFRAQTPEAEKAPTINLNAR